RSVLGSSGQGCELMGMNSSRQYVRSQNPPVSTPWPILLALGITLFFAGMFTSAAVCILGGVLCLAAFIGQLRNPPLLQSVDSASFLAESGNATAAEKDQAGWINSDALQSPRSYRGYPLSAGAMGGLAGSVVTGALALLYGLVSRHGICYPINLLASEFLPARETAQISVFPWNAFIVASA